MPKRRTLFGIILVMLIWLLPIYAFTRPENTVASSQLTYTLDWEWGNATVTDDGWQVTTNLDYTVNITTGYLVAYETQLTACDHTHGWFDDWFTVSTVYAGHGDQSNNSTLSTSWVEDVSNPQAHTWGTVTLYEPTYCEAFFLVARGASDTANQPDTLDMFGTSIYLEGTYSTPNSDALIPFTLQTPHANGTVQPFLQNDQSVHLALSQTPMEIAIIRSLDTLLDDIHFAQDNPDDAAFQVLRNVLNQTQFLVISGNTHQD